MFSSGSAFLYATQSISAGARTLSAALRRLAKASLARSASCLVSSLVILALTVAQSRWAALEGAVDIALQSGDCQHIANRCLIIVLCRQT